MRHVRSTLGYAFAAVMIVCAYHAGAVAASLLTVPSHAMARPVAVPITAEIAERVA